MSEVIQLVDGVDFGEGPRWRDGRLWYSDFYQEKVYAVGLDGVREVMVDMAGIDRPSGLGWMPDGSLLIVSMVDQAVLRVTEPGTVNASAPVKHADLSGILNGKCNDMVVDAMGRAYVGSFGFDLEAGESLSPSGLALVQPDGSATLAADELMFPNGTVITPDGSTLIVGETFAGQYTAFTIDAETGALSDRRVWATGLEAAPDGCALDAEGGIWLADATTPRVIRVVEGSTITDEIEVPQQPYAAMLGGADGTTLFILTSPGSHPDQVAGVAGGAIWTVSVSHPHAGRP